MSEGKRCGAHVELAKNGSARITRCGCGQIHLHILHNGLTVQISAEHFNEVARGIAAAASELEEGASSEATPISRIN